MRTLLEREYCRLTRKSQLTVNFRDSNVKGGCIVENGDLTTLVICYFNRRSDWRD